MRFNLNIKFKYGVKIFEKIDAALRPKFKRDKSIDAFDPWLGADFELKICLNDRKYWSYEQSNFSRPSSFLDAGEDEDTGWPELSKVYDAMYNLNEIIAPENFKSNEDLQKRLDIVLNNSEASRKKIDSELEEEVEDDYSNLVQSKSTSSKAPTASVSQTDDDDDDEDEEVDEALDYFSRLANS